MHLPTRLVDEVLTKLGLHRLPEPTLEGLARVYAAWCRAVPFDNVRKLIHVRAGKAGPLPGSSAEDFFSAWLKYGTGGTCWSGAGAMHAFLTSLGFNAVRGIATMLVTPDLPPNHGTVMVKFGDERFLVDTSILHGEPLRLVDDAETRIDHPAWGVRCAKRDGKLHISWRPFHRVEGFECRLEGFGPEANDFEARYEKTRGWSPFNYEVTGRVNRRDTAVGVAFGHAVTLNGDGSVTKRQINHQERLRILIEDVGLSEEIVRGLPEDTPTPPPPWSTTARISGTVAQQ